MFGTHPVPGQSRKFVYVYVFFGHGEVRVYRGTGVSRRVRQTTWERSLKNWEKPNPLFWRVFLGREHIGTRPCQSPSQFGIRLYFLRPHFPSPKFFLSLKIIGSRKKPRNRKHINIFLTALVGQSSQGRTPTRPRDKRDKMARFYCGIKQRKAGLSQGRVPFCPGEGSHLSQGRFLFVPDTVPPKMFMFIGLFLSRNSRRRKRWKTNGEKMVDFWCRFFHGLVPIFSRFTPIFHGL